VSLSWLIRPFGFSIPATGRTHYTARMRICRFKQNDVVRIGLVVENSTVLDLTAAGITSLTAILEEENPAARLDKLAREKLPSFPLAQVQLLAPVEQQEVWAAGVTYLRSKTARMEESDFSASAYDKVYAAERPEIFFKSLAEKVSGPGTSVGIRKDAKWNVPEPELALVVNAKGNIAGYTIGNDMSSRDIEGENLLYLPQAKIYKYSCALGPWITVGAAESDVRQWLIRIAIRRDGTVAFQGETSVDRIKRSFVELVNYLFRSQEFPHGAVLLTGTGVVPDDSFTLRANDITEIEISGIGSLKNTVAVV
jgi:2-dehydro-3-deoxy-D-arabinonate dehydratase